MTSMLRSRSPLGLGIVILALIASVFTGSMAHAGDAEPSRLIRIHTQLAAQPQDVHTRTVGSSPELEYGTLRLAGRAVVDGDRYELEVVVGLEYADGSGPWTGFMTLTSAEHGVLSMAYDGRTRMLPDGDSRVRGRMTVIGGTGEFSRVVGGGTARAYRDGSAGSLTDYVVVIALERGTPAVHEEGIVPAANPAPTDVIHADLSGTSRDQHITALPNGRSYGIGRLQSGAGSIDERSGVYAESITGIELLGVVDYEDGGGPFTGFINLTDGTGSLIGMRYTGTAVHRADGSTDIYGELTVIASSGRFAGMRGGGSIVSRRTGVIGEPLDSHMALTLRQARTHSASTQLAMGESRQEAA